MRISDWSSDVCSADLGAGGTVNLNLGAINRTGGLANFVLPDSGAITTCNPDGVLCGWATINGSDYAKVLGGGIIAFDASDHTDKGDASTWLGAEIINASENAPDTTSFGPVGGRTEEGRSGKE